MAQIDPQMAQRVWQRVQAASSTAPADAGLQILLEALWEDHNTFRLLAHRSRGKRAAIYARLYRQTGEQLSILKGICALTQGCAPVFSPTSSSRREPEQQLLRRSYSRALQRLSWFSSGENDPRYAHTLPALIRQTQQHTRWLLQLMAGNKDAQSSLAKGI